MFKKIAAVLCVAAMLLGVTACGKTNDSTQNESVSGAQEKALSFSKEGGIYDEAFDLEISGADEIWYTLDGSDPTKSDTAVKYEGALAITDRSGDKNGVGCFAVAFLHELQQLFQEKRDNLQYRGSEGFGG